MAHWFHRNPIKATNDVTYELKKVLTNNETAKICSDLKLCRANLLEYMRDSNNEYAVVDEQFNNYLSLICGFCHAVDKKGEDSKLRLLICYRWTQSMLGNTPIELCDSWFEALSMITNMALWLMKHAAKIAGKDEVTESEAKMVHRCLRKAAGLFSQVQEEKSRLGSDLTVAVSKGSDFDAQVLSGYITQCTAEAQEVTVARAIELAHNPGLISALSNETSKLFQQADSALSTQDQVSFEKWRKYLQLKGQFYLGYAYCYLGKSLLAEDKCGQAIRAAKEGERSKPETHLFFRRLKSTLKLVLGQCERENSLIYHQTVAEEVPALEIKATYGLVKPEEFQWPKPDPLWNDKNYKAFNISKAKTPNFGKAKKGEKELPPVKEEPIYQTDKDPKNSSGCVLS